MQLSGRLCAYSLRGGAALDDRSDGRAPWGVYPCAGDDEWCVITVRDDDDWRRLRSALGDPGWAAQKRFATAAGRRDCAREIDLLLSRWTRTLRPRALAARLQAAGVPAGFMQRPDEYDADPGFTARGLLRTFEQPGLEPLRVEDAPFRSERIPAPLDSRAPEPGEHTREICSTLLGLDDAEIERLVAAGALEAPAAVGSDRPRPRPRARPAGLRRHPDEGLADRLAGQQPR
jgi:crotonobetainyl-CoA:carnitine CoA-transferase CaiB-like acyl-CoA transferase